MVEDRAADAILILIVVTIIVLKCCNIIQVSWLWLTAIIWIPFSAGCLLAIFLVLMFIIESYIDKRRIDK